MSHRTDATVLVVEDDRTLLEGLGEALGAAGYVALLAEDAAAALAALETARPDVIVSDIVMPKMDGYALLAAVRQRPELGTVPFIFLTALGEREEVREGMSSGADDYIAKPFKPEELLRSIACRLDRRRAIEAAELRDRDEWVRRLGTSLHHELRTPLAEVSAYAELLAATEPGPSAEDVRAIVVGLDHGVARLARLVGDFLSLTDLQSGQTQRDFEARRGPVSDGSGIVASALARAEPAARDRGTRLSAGDVAQWSTVNADPLLLTEALGRLLERAVRVSPRGSEVTVTTGIQGDALVLDVQDLGPTLEPGYLEALEPSSPPAAGLSFDAWPPGHGLAICRDLIALQGGTLTAEPLPEGGMRWRITLPLAESEPPSVRPPAG
jgi:two-component system sensor histidine kinase/response regulator